MGHGVVLCLRKVSCDCLVVLRSWKGTYINLCVLYLCTHGSGTILYGLWGQRSQQRCDGEHSGHSDMFCVVNVMKTTFKSLRGARMDVKNTGVESIEGAVPSIGSVSNMSQSSGSRFSK